ncbi:hypothetical protein PV08_05312 [Exophiala spinifera]|uniref:Uncharacterized protein n=1 Tax=Exophiala spinifera TaxID=91928 RepID=A0A0D1ZR24_9EURO|nr:uncharacterized protein PV08_05312 [Exophiala spinifera]KIW15267.1 hypothetical protein PV08_05312 [Exophiala spinifera]
MSASPPPYADSYDRREDRLPPYRASHGFANSQEELAALRDFAQSKLYVDPGTNGMLPDIRSGMGMRSLSVGGPASQDSAVAGLTPETDEERKQRRAAEKAAKKAERERRGSLTERLVRVISGGGGGGGSSSSSKDVASGPAK